MSAPSARQNTRGMCILVIASVDNQRGLNGASEASAYQLSFSRTSALSLTEGTYRLICFPGAAILSRFFGLCLMRRQYLNILRDHLN